MTEQETAKSAGLMTAEQARQQTNTKRKGDPATVAKILDYYRRAIDEESRAGNRSVTHYPADLLENRVTRHDVAEVQQALEEHGYDVDDKGVSWLGEEAFGNEYGGILARAINPKCVRRPQA